MVYNMVYNMVYTIMYKMIHKMISFYDHFYINCNSLVLLMVLTRHKITFNNSPTEYIPF